jgi:hypothetical protein
MRSILFGSFLVLAVAACGDDSGNNTTPDGPGGGDGAGTVDAGPRNCGGNGGADCFDLPKGVLAVGTAAPNLACGAVTPMTADHAITVSGTIYDFQNENDALPGATLDAFYTDITGAPDETATADASGDYMITLDAGRNLMGWRTNRPTGGLPTYAIYTPLDITQTTVTEETRRNVSLTTANALPALIGVSRTEGLGVVAGLVADCSGDELTHAVGTLATGTSDGNPENIPFLAGASVYYFSGNFPVRHNDTSSGRVDTSENGLFVVIEIPPTASGEQVYLEVWGFLTQADMDMGQAGLTLLAEIPTPVIGDSVISGTMLPNKGPF